MTKLKELVTKEKKRNEGGPDVMVMQQDDDPRLKELEDKITQLTERIIALREENDQLRSNANVQQPDRVDCATATD